ncbi:MAG: DUF3473 domain-containing protein [Acidimicrobiales bacterium]
MTLDVEDFYEGMAVLGASVDPPRGCRSDLTGFLDELSARSSGARLTLFVVADYVARTPEVRIALERFCTAGHEIACHGQDHGRLPDTGLVPWLRKGREMLEDTFQVSVRGFRSPRFDIATHGDLARYREELAAAGYEYVSDDSLLGSGAAVLEFPVLRWRGVRIGGGSYQRLIPSNVVAGSVRRSSTPAVCYYHSYDFDGSIPGIGSVRSAALARQVIGRKRIPPAFWRLLRRFGSVTCARAAR